MCKNKKYETLLSEIIEEFKNKKYETLLSEIIKEFKNKYNNISIQKIELKICTKEEILMTYKDCYIKEQIKKFRGLFSKDSSFIWVDSTLESIIKIICLLHEIGHYNDSEKREKSHYSKNSYFANNFISETISPIFNKEIMKELFEEIIKQEIEAETYAIEYIKNKKWDKNIEEELLKNIEKNLLSNIEKYKKYINMDMLEKSKEDPFEIALAKTNPDYSNHILKLYFNQHE